MDQDTLRRKNEELTQVLREKNRKLLQTQELYDKLKRRSMLGQVQDAASEAVDDTVQGSNLTNHFDNRIAGQNQHPVSHSIFQGAQSGRIQISGSGLSAGVNMAPPQISRVGNADGAWPGFSSQGRQEGIPRKCSDDRIPFQP